jgi:hypothetical protein
MVDFKLKTGNVSNILSVFSYYHCTPKQSNMKATDKKYVEILKEAVKRANLTHLNEIAVIAQFEDLLKPYKKYTTDGTGKCTVFSGNKVIAMSFLKISGGYEVRILQGMDRNKTAEKIIKDCPEFAKANNLTNDTYVYLFSQELGKKQEKHYRDLKKQRIADIINKMAECTLKFKALNAIMDKTHEFHQGWIELNSEMNKLETEIQTYGFKLGSVKFRELQHKLRPDVYNFTTL